MERNVWVRPCESNGCVEVKWISACSSGGCVEVSHHDDRVLVRDGKLEEKSPVIEFTRSMWGWVLDRIRGDLILATVSVGPTSVHWRSGIERDAVVLEFTRQEWDEFVEGVKAGKFDLDEAVASG